MQPVWFRRLERDPIRIRPPAPSTSRVISRS
jgi:hypothetical protein